MAIWATGGTAIAATQGTAPHNYPRTGAAIDGNTTHNIEEVRHIETAQPQTALGALLAAIRSPIVRQAPVNSLAARAPLLPATGAEPD
jgi:hypothetical protein